MSHRLLCFLVRAMSLGVVVVSLSAAPSTAGVTPFSRIDVIKTFDFSGSFDTGTFGTGYFPLSGQMTIDTTAGFVTGQTIARFGPSSFCGQGTNHFAEAYEVCIVDPVGEYDIFFDTQSLVDYSGGELGSEAFPTAGESVSAYYYSIPTRSPAYPLIFGTATLAPEPDSLWVLSLASAGMVLLSRRLKARVR